MNLLHALVRSRTLWPDSVVTIDGDQVRTTAEVAARVAALGGALQRLGVAAGDRVGIVALNSHHHHEVFFASWWAGAVAHPINTRWSAADIAYALADSGTRVLFVDDDFAGCGPELRERAPGLETLVYCGAGEVPEGMVGYEALVAGGDPIAAVPRSDEDLAFLLYTGGTTGHPKGVMITHRSFLTSVLSQHVSGGFPVRQGGVTLVTAPLFHVGALLIWYSQSLGGTSVFLPAFAPDPVDTATCASTRSRSCTPTSGSTASTAAPTK